ncbi:MAG: right-handed parallel beta-helix repeat-containing protein [Pirellulaceae bacterium]
MQVVNNRVFDNRDVGIRLQNNVLVEGNTVYGQRDGTGIESFDAGIIRGNTVRNNRVGISAGGDARAESNRVFQNEVGVQVNRDAEAVGNRVYANDTGVRTFDSSFRGRIAQNLIYDNAVVGIELSNLTVGNHIENNTVSASSADAIRVNTASSDALLRNNILQVDAGRAIVVDADSQQGFVSDYNLFNITGGGKVGSFNNAEYVTLFGLVHRVGSRHKQRGRRPAIRRSQRHGRLGVATADADRS